MKRIRTITLTILFVLLFSIQSFATTTLELTSKFTTAEQSVKEEVKSAEQDLMDRTYPVGSIYITTENLSASQVANRLGTGEWKEMKNTFLWARDPDQALGNDLIKGGKTNYSFSALAGQFKSDPSGGNEFDRIRFAYLYGLEVPAYMLADPGDGGHNPTTVIASEKDEEESSSQNSGNSEGSGNSENPNGESNEGNEGSGSTPSSSSESSDFNFGSSIKVTEEGETDIEIMPPYTVVKMFRRTA